MNTSEIISLCFSSLPDVIKLRTNSSVLDGPFNQADDDFVYYQNINKIMRQFSIDPKNFTISDKKGLNVNNLQDVIDKFGNFAYIDQFPVTVTGSGPWHDCWTYKTLRLRNSISDQKFWRSQWDPSEKENYNQTINMYSGVPTTVPKNYEWILDCESGGCGCNTGLHENVMAQGYYDITINRKLFCESLRTSSTTEVQVASNLTSPANDVNWGNFSIGSYSQYTLPDPFDKTKTITLQNLIDRVGQQNIEVLLNNLIIRGILTKPECNMNISLKLNGGSESKLIYLSEYSQSIDFNINSTVNMFTGKLSNMPKNYFFSNTCRGNCDCVRGDFKSFNVFCKLIIKVSDGVPAPVGPVGPVGPGPVGPVGPSGPVGPGGMTAGGMTAGPAPAPPAPKPPSPTPETNKSNQGLIIGLSLGVVALVVLGVIAFFVIRRRRKAKSLK
jgi:hypothetical protein